MLEVHIYIFTYIFYLDLERELVLYIKEFADSKTFCI